MLRCAVLICLLAGAARAESLSRTIEGRSLQVTGLCAASVTIRPEPGLAAVSVAANAANADELAALRFTGGPVATVTREPHACFEGRSPTLTVEITIPPRLAVELRDGGSADYRIGSVGALGATMSGSSALSVESAAALTLNLSGSGHATVARASGRASLRMSGSGEMTVAQASFAQTDVLLSGSGKIAIKAGSVGALKVRAAGSGTVRIDGDATEAALDASGSAQVFVAHAIRVRQRPSGSSVITVGP